MRKFLALTLAGILLLGAVCAAAEDAAPVYSYDFNLRFEINPLAYPFRERQHAQGYADLLDLLEIKGTMARCPRTASADVKVELIPRTNPAAVVALRLYGTSDMMRVETPLLGKETVCFRPTGLMAFAKRAWEAFKIPLPYYVLLVPDTTVNAFRCIPDVWNEIVGPVSSRTTLSAARLEQLSYTWWVKLVGGDLPKNWTTAIGYPMEDPEALQTAVADLSKLLQLASGGKGLKFTEEKTDTEKTLRLVNAKREVLFEEYSAENAYACALTIPEIPVDYIPSFSYRTETKDGKIALSLSADWTRGPGTGDEGHEYHAEWPKNLLTLRLTLENLPAAYPADSVFTGEVSLEGALLPNFHYLLKGRTAENGEVSLSLLRAEEEGNPLVFAVSGTVVPAEYSGSLSYVTEGMETAYNLFGLNEDTLRSLVNAVDKPLLKGLIDFLYELPASSCQSIMDDLESFGLVQVLLP